MAKKIPQTNQRVPWVRGHVPLVQHSDFAEYREFMAAYFEARQWWIAEAQRPGADPCCKFWFQGLTHSAVFYSLMESWMRGYWLTRKELRANCQAVSDSAFARVLNQADQANYISRDGKAGEDSREKLIMPTREAIIMIEAYTCRYFRVIVDNSHKMNSYTQGLQLRVNQIEALDDVRKEQLGWSIFDRQWLPD